MAVAKATAIDLLIMKEVSKPPECEEFVKAHLNVWGADNMSQRFGRVEKFIELRNRQKELVGMGCLKNPFQSYRKKIFKKAGARRRRHYNWELGYVVLIPKYRGLNLSFELCEQGIDGYTQEGIFATTQSNNEPMRHTLSKLGFEPAGNPFQSELNKQKLILYTLLEKPNEDVENSILAFPKFNFSFNTIAETADG